MGINGHIKLIRGIGDRAISTSIPIIAKSGLCTNISSPSERLVTTEHDVDITATHLHNITARWNGKDLYPLDILRAYGP